MLRAPNGAVKDAATIGPRASLTTIPAKITVPTMLIRRMGSRYAALHGADAISAPHRYADETVCESTEGTHTIIMEKNRMKLFEAVQQFLEEKLNGPRS